jgi:hypothetical protein
MPNFGNIARARITPHEVELDLQSGRPSPLASAPLGVAVLRTVVALSSDDTRLHPLTEDEFAALKVAIDAALHQSIAVIRHGHSMGGDEVLYGRAGLLWALLNVRKLSDARRREGAVEFPGSLQSLLDAIPRLVNVILQAGKDGAKEFVSAHGEGDAYPLMWPWLDEYYGVGA